MMTEAETRVSESLRCGGGRGETGVGGRRGGGGIPIARLPLTRAIHAVTVDSISLRRKLTEDRERQCR